jgi:hypothetical protein
MPDNYPTLMDVARRSGDQSATEIVEVLNKTNQALDDIPWIECNGGVVHKTTTRTSIPTPVWRMLNGGVPVAKSTTKQMTVGCGMLEVYAEVDCDQVNLAGRGIIDKAQANAAVSKAIKGENEAFIEGFGQEISRVMFYGDPSVPQEPLGLTHWYSAAGGTNVIDGGGTGSDNTSIWLIAWDKQAIHGIYPQGTVGGLHEKFLGEQTVKDAAGNQFQAYRTHYKWDAGFCVRDLRCGARICNIDMSDLSGSSAADLVDLMVKALYKLPRFARSQFRKAFYMRPELAEILDKQARKTSNLMLNYGDVFGKEILTFRGVPVREQESILDSEARVV